MTATDVLEDLLASRYSCRGFKPDPVPRATIERILGVVRAVVRATIVRRVVVGPRPLGIAGGQGRAPQQHRAQRPPGAGEVARSPGPRVMISCVDSAGGAHEFQGRGRSHARYLKQRLKPIGGSFPRDPPGPGRIAPTKTPYEPLDALARCADAG